MKSDNNKNATSREGAFKEYFSVVTRIVYTLNSIVERNDIIRRFNNNAEKGIGFEYTEESIISDSKMTGYENTFESLNALTDSIKLDLVKVKKYEKYNFNIEKFIKDLKLNNDERFVIYCLIVYSIYGDSITAIPVRRLLELITLDDDIYLNKYHYFEDKSKLMSSGIFMFSREPYSSGGILELSYTLMSFINNKVLFSFLEKEDYSVIESVFATSKVDKQDLKSRKIIKNERSSSSILTPKEILKELNRSVIGQNNAKKALSVHGYLHCLRSNGSMNVPFRSNIMMIGPTGVGKTYLVRTLSDILGFPFVRADVTTLTETGYVGDDVEVILYDLYRNAKWDLDQTQKGIVFLDEVDKIAKADAHQSTTGNPSDKAVQEALLSIMNGEDVRVPEFGDRRMMHSSEGITINTTNILFIFGGAFVGLEDIVKARLKGESNLGFGGNKNMDKMLSTNKILADVDVKDIEKYGMIPEFIGRIPIVVTLEKLTKKDLRDILLDSVDSPILKYKDFFKSMGKTFTVSESAISAIVDKALSINMGARSLKSVVETAMVNVLFNLDGVKGNALTLSKKDIEMSFESDYKELDIQSSDECEKTSSRNKKNDKPFMA